MKNNQLYPFERNRYYAGKMLTSADFQAEQTYMNNKRRFINSMMYGSGVICGCNVFSLDDLSVLVESGAAVDDLGREIVIESSVVKKLSAIEGFDGLSTNEVLLCIRYQEEPVQSVYAVNRQGQKDSYEYNRIREGYELFLMDADAAEDGFALEDEFFSVNTLYENRDYRIVCRIPARISRGSYVRVHITLEKLSVSADEITFQGKLQIPAFSAEDGRHELDLSFEKVHLLPGESVQRDYWIHEEGSQTQETDLVFTGAEGSQSFQVTVLEETPWNLVNSEIGKTSLEMRGLEEHRDYIPLAWMRLVRTDSAYLIDEVRERGVKKYILTPSQEEKRREFGAYFSEEAPNGGTANAGKEETEITVSESDMSRPMVATGILEIPLGTDAKKGDIRYSGEIMHGLGRGNVYVEIGCEHYDSDPVLGANIKSTVYGNASLFAETEGMGSVETAVKVLNDKGSFIAAAKLLKNVDSLLLTYRWVAIRFPSGEDMLPEEDYSDKSITAETPTVVLGTGESYYFHVKFHNMESCSIAYELTEGGSGEITSDGVYTAPRKEGVYEIRIYCTDIPIICTYAYAIVRSKKGGEQE